MGDVVNFNQAKEKTEQKRKAEQKRKTTNKKLIKKMKRKDTKNHLTYNDGIGKLFNVKFFYIIILFIITVFAIFSFIQP